MLFSAISFANPHNHHINPSHEVMEKSMKAMDGMHNLSLTGNPDVDFLAGMVPHHDGAIVMSQMMQKNLSDPELASLAESIIESQQEEIKFMNAWLSANPAKLEDKKNIQYSKKMMQETMRVMHGMHSAELTGEVNRDFVLGMVPHHEAAVEMAKVILPYLKDEQVIQFANNVIKIQMKEIDLMNAWLKNANQDPEKSKQIDV